MTEIAPLPEWLQHEFLERGCQGTPYVVHGHSGQSTIWGTPDHVYIAKVYEPSEAWRAEREQVAANQVVGAVPSVPPLDVSRGDDGRAALWMRWEHIAGSADIVEATQWVRALHDSAQTDGLEGFPFDLWLPTEPDDKVLPGKIQPWVDEAYKILLEFEAGERVVIHGEPTRSNILKSVRPDDGDTYVTTVGMDFARSGLGPRAYDVAMIAVSAVEHGLGNLDDVLAAYGPHEHVTEENVAKAATAVAVNRLLEAARMNDESTNARLAALHAGRWFVQTGR
jgi:hypothetical protein